MRMYACVPYNFPMASHNLLLLVLLLKTLIPVAMAWYTFGTCPLVCPSLLNTVALRRRLLHLVVCLDAGRLLLLPVHVRDVLLLHDLLLLHDEHWGWAFSVVSEVGLVPVEPLLTKVFLPRQVVLR